MPEPIIPEDGMKITRDTVLKPGVYFLPNGIEIAADSVTLDGGGALLIGDNFAGNGVLARQRSGVTIRNLQIERYYHGMSITASANVHIENCRITRTHELAGPGVFLDVWLDRGDAYGGALLLAGVQDGVIIGNDLQHQQNGILMYGCDHMRIEHNNASYNSGYGILLYASSENQVLDNVADYCSRIYQSGPTAERYHNGADAAALVMMCNSSKNRVIGNLLRSGGDGVFLGGFHKDRIVAPCNDNLFERNDCSDSPNIAFEATFSQRNVFRENRADNCNYGFWLGWSSENTVENNQIRNNRVAGIAIEHGHHNDINANTFEKNRVGVQLWTNLDEQRSTGLFREYFPLGAESHETRIRNNRFSQHNTAIHGWSQRGELPIAHCHHFDVSNNELLDNRVAVLFERVRESRIINNRILDNLQAGVKMIGCDGVIVDANVMER